MDYFFWKIKETSLSSITVKCLIQAPIHENNFSPKPKTENIANLEKKTNISNTNRTVAYYLSIALPVHKKWTKKLIFILHMATKQVLSINIS